MYLFAIYMYLQFILISQYMIDTAGGNGAVKTLFNLLIK